jgi:hypothetical protein
VTMLDSIYNRFLSVDVTSDSGYVFAGQYQSVPVADRDFYVVKMSTGGAVEWETVYGTPTEDVALSVQQIDSGDYIIGGHTNLSGSGDFDAFVVRTGSLSGVAGGSADKAMSPGLALRAWPNPSTGSATIAFDLALGGKTEVKIYDVAGKLVAGLLQEDLSAGPQSFEWNGKDLTGADAPAGVYFFSVKSGDVTATGKVVLVR